MNIRCPTCDSEEIRLSQAQSTSENILNVFGYCPMRCRVCDTRFRASLWKITSFRYARCPKCYKTDLSTWELEYYNPPTTTLVLLQLGAKPMRCEYCRCNFVSFRQRRSKFERRAREIPPKALAEPGPERR